MKIFLVNFKRVLTSKLFYFSIIGVSLICLFGAFTDGTQLVVQCFMNVMLISSYRNLIIFFGALPFSAAFCNEWNTRSTYYIIERTSMKKYLLSHIVIQFLSSFLVAFIGMFIAVIAMCFFLPDFCNNVNGTGIAFSQFANEEKGWILLFFMIYHYAISVAAWSVSGIAVSAIFNDPYIAICSPIVISYVLELLTIGSGQYTDLWILSISYCNISENPIVVSLYITFVFLIVALIFAIIFFKQAKRRICCDIV